MYSFDFCVSIHLLLRLDLFLWQAFTQLCTYAVVQAEQLDVTSEADESMKESTLSSPVSDTAEHDGMASDLF